MIQKESSDFDIFGNDSGEELTVPTYQVVRVEDDGPKVELIEEVGVPEYRYGSKKKDKSGKREQQLFLETVKKKVLDLSTKQQLHANFINALLDKEGVYVDVSETGMGKTIIAIYLSIVRNLGLFVLGKVSMEHDWVITSEEYSARFVEYNGSTAAISGSKRKGKFMQPKSGYVRMTPNGYEVTEKFKALVDEGILFILDEAQTAKNKSSKISETITCMTKYIIRLGNENTRSRVGLLSASIVDKKEHVGTLSQIMGLTDIVKNINYTNLIKQIRDKCYEIDFDLTYDIINADLLASEKFVELMSQVIWKKFSSEIVDPDCYVDIATISRNSFFIMKKKDEAIYAQRVRELKQAVEAKAKNLTLFTYIENIELIKIKVIYRLIMKDIMDKTSSRKILVFLGYSNPIKSLANKLYNKRVNHVVITGDTKSTGVWSERAKLVHRFNTDPECRVVIFQVKVGSVGLSLHDTTGLYPRVSYISPSFSMQDAYQSAGRTKRKGVKSDVEMNIVYIRRLDDNNGGFDYETEKALLESIEIKSELCQKFRRDKKSTVFPGSFVRYEEQTPKEQEAINLLINKTLEESSYSDE